MLLMVNPMAREARVVHTPIQRKIGTPTTKNTAVRPVISQSKVPSSMDSFLSRPERSALSRSLNPFYSPDPCYTWVSSPPLGWVWSGSFLIMA